MSDERVRANCPKCQKTLSVPNMLVGKQLKCPCGQVFKIAAAEKSSRFSYRKCGSCAKRLKIPSHFAKKNVKCPCGQIVTPSGVKQSQPEVSEVKQFEIARRMLGQHVVKFKCPRCSLGMSLEESECSTSHACPECGVLFRLAASAVSKLAGKIELNAEAKRQKVESKKAAKEEKTKARIEALREKELKQQEVQVEQHNANTHPDASPFDAASGVTQFNQTPTPNVGLASHVSSMSAGNCWYCRQPTYQAQQCCFCRMLV